MGFLSTLTGSNIGNATKTAIGQNQQVLNGFGTTAHAIEDANDSNSINALNQGVSNYSPYLQSGQAANTMYSNALGLNGAAGNTAATGAFQTSPGYDFSLQQGEQSALRGASAGGMLNSGNTLTALAKYGTGVANQEYGSWLDRLNGQSQQGLSAANGQGSQLDDLSNTYQNIGQNRVGLESSLAQGTMGLNNNLASVKEQQSQNSTGLLQGLVSGGAKLAGQALTSGLF